MPWDTRGEKRKQISVEVRIRLNPATQETVHLAKDSIEARLVDVSALGMGFLSSVFLPPGALIDFELPRSFLAVPDRQAPKGSMKITGRIVHARAQGEGCRLGISITQIEEADRDLLRAFTSSGERRREPRI